MGSSSKLLEHTEAIVIVVVGAELRDYGLISERGGLDLVCTVAVIEDVW